MNQENRKKLVLVDGSSYLFRAYHGLPPLTHNRHPTGAIYGVLNMLRKLIADEQPDNIAVVFDAKGKTFRNDIYAEYKANRPPMPDDLRVQIEPLHKIIKAQGLPLIVIDDVEADDVIGTFSVEASRNGYSVLISTGDKDMAQLVNADVRLINTMNNHIMTEATVPEKFQVNPNQIIDLLALMGDTSDNIPGVPKVGPKTAAKWLAEYDTLQGVMDHADEIKGKVGENLRESLDFLPMSYQLATIKLDCETGINIEDLVQAEADTGALAGYYQQFGFNRWLEELDSGSSVMPEAEKLPSGEYECVLSDEAFARWLEKLQKAARFAVDTETTSIDYMLAELVGISFCVEVGKACYIPLAHRYEGAPRQLDKKSVLKVLKPILENPAIGKIGQNIKYDAHIFIGEGIQMQGLADDTMLQSYILNSTASRHNMDALAFYYLGRETIHYEEVAGKGAKQIGFDQVELSKASDYAAEDADITLQLNDCLSEKLQQTGRLKQVYEEIELPLVEVLLKLEQNGVLIDQAMLEKQGVEVDHQLGEIETSVYEQAGEVFNLSSPRQIQAILYDKLELPVLRKTPEGAAFYG